MSTPTSMISGGGRLDGQLYQPVNDRTALVDRPATPIQITRIEAQLRTALVAAGLPSYDGPLDDDRFIRWDEKHPRNGDCWLIVHRLHNGHLCASFGDHRAGSSQTWRSWEDADGTATDHDPEALQRALAERQRERQAQRQQRHRAAEAQAHALWDACTDEGDHEYLQRKGVGAHGIRFGHDERGPFLAIPMQAVDGNLCNIQRIHGDGQHPDKRFLKGAAKQARFHPIGDISAAPAIWITEGYATGATVHEATSEPVAVAFDAGNLLPVALALAGAYPGARLQFAADNDGWKASENGPNGKPRGNTGIDKARAAAERVDGLFVAPCFEGLDTRSRPTDWNDLAALAGLDAVRAQLQALTPVRPPSPPIEVYAEEPAHHPAPALPAYVAPADNAEVMTVEAFREKLSAVVADAIRNPTDTQGNPRRIVVRGLTGLGKTSVVAAEVQASGVGALWYAPTKKQAAETTAQLGPHARHMLGRSAIDPAGDGETPMCWRGPELAAVQAAGLGRHTKPLLCVDESDDDPELHHRCPHFGQCGFYRQILDDSPTIKVGAHEYLTLSSAEAMAMGNADLAVIDESPLKILVSHHHTPADELIARGGAVAEIVQRLIQGEGMAEIVASVDVGGYTRALEAELVALEKAASLPAVFPSKSAATNLGALQAYDPGPERLAGTVRALVAALQGEVNRVWHGVDTEGRHRLYHATRKTPSAVEQLPVIVLDASADPEVYQALFGAEVEFHNWSVAIPTDAVQVTQITDATLYKRKLADPDNANLRDRVAALCQATGAGLISHKDVVQQLRDSGALPESWPVGNFNGLRGLDGMKDCPALVVAGRIEPSPLAMEAIARALWPSEPLALGQQYIPTTGHYHMRDGSTQPATLRAHPDARVNAVLAQHRDAELQQAVGRLRAIHGASGRHLFVLTSVPVPGLVVDRLCELDALLPDARAARGLLAGGVLLPLSARVLQALLADDFETETAAKRWADRARKGYQTRESCDYLGNGTLFRPVIYRIAGQRVSDTSALTWLDDIGEIRAALARMHGAEVLRCEFIEFSQGNPRFQSREELRRCAKRTPDYTQG